MKQAILTFEKAKILVIELPEDLDRFIMAYGNCIGWLDKEGMCCTEQPLGEDSDESLELIGKLSELTEDQAREIVDSWQRYFPEQHTVYRNYEYPIEYDHIKGMEQRWSHPFGKSVESFLSKLRADGCQTENVPEPDKCGCYGPCGLKCDYADWQEANDRTFYPDKTWVFTIKQ